MSFSDFAQGQVLASRQANKAIGEWEQFAKNLQAKLSKAESSRLGFAQLALALAAELERVDPRNPLLDKNTQLSIVESQGKKASR